MVKIGRTKNLDQRLRELNNILPMPFEFIKTYEVENSAYVEKHIHEALSNRRFRDDREFFTIDNEPQIITICDELIADYAHFYLKRKYKTFNKLSSFDQMAEIIRKTRIAKMLTQEDLALKTGTSKATLNRLENGKFTTSMDVLLKITDELGIGIYCGLSEDQSGTRRRSRKYYQVYPPPKAP